MNTKSDHKLSRQRVSRAVKVLVGASVLAVGVGAAWAAVAPASAKAPTSVVGLHLGSKGYPVALVQQSLQAAGFPPAGGVDGSYGAGTESQVREFQKTKGLEQNGTIDAATASALGLNDTSAAQPKATGAASSGVAAATPLKVDTMAGLSKGATGSAVVNLQARLVELGVTVNGGVDGHFGTGTTTAVTNYQNAVGLPATGKVDEATAQALVDGRKPAAGVPAAAPAPAAPAAPATLVGLKSGSQGAAVIDLQSQLAKVGVTVRGGADGVFGPATISALKSFQSSQGLPATGVVDEATLNALKAPKPAAPKPAVTTAGSTSPYGSYGEQSSRITALQKALGAAGQNIGTDGQFGARTSAAVMAFQKQSGLAVTGKVDEATAKALGLTATDKSVAPEAPAVSIDAFPVQAGCGYVNTWGDPRGGGRSHIGVDILADTGKEIYAVKDGTITKVYADYPGALAGNGVRLTTADGTYFFYAHMTNVADGIGLGVPVKAGQLIGYVGSTGNAGVPHLHFEVHPGGGSAINPYPVVKAVNAC